MITGDLALHHNLQITLFDNRENYQEFYGFIQNIQRNFNPQTVIFPGHGDMTTVEQELTKNKKWKYIIQRECHGN